ncbi:MAG: hypothetical protein JNL57_13745 [Bacteroidetes bacterium]|nr:hypothetical protein [Bacteroidota bacterium]
MNRLGGIILFLFGINLRAQSSFIALGQNPANPMSAFSLAVSPAVFPKSKMSAGVWGGNRFTGTDLANGGICGHFQLRHTALGLSTTYAGRPEHAFTTVQANLSQQFSPRLSAGVSAGVSSILQISGYPNQSRFTGKLGLLYTFIPNAEVSVLLENPWLDHRSFFPEYPLAALSVGYHFDTITRAWIQYRNDPQRGPVWGVAVAHSPARNITLFASAQTGAEPLAGGIRFQKSALRAELSTAWHSRLGFSPTFSLLWSAR